MLDRRAMLLAAGASLLSVVGATDAQAAGDITTVSGPMKASVLNMSFTRADKAK